MDLARFDYEEYGCLAFALSFFFVALYFTQSLYVGVFSGTDSLVDSVFKVLTVYGCSYVSNAFITSLCLSYGRYLEYLKGFHES
jgi:hypothetical protein